MKSLLQKNASIKHYKAITVLAFLSVVFAFISSLLSFVEYAVDSKTNIGQLYFNNLSLSSIIAFILFTTPYILFFVYMLNDKQKNTAICIPIVFIMFSLNFLYNLTGKIINYIQLGVFTAPNIYSILFEVIYAAVLIICVISAFAGLYDKKPIVILIVLKFCNLVIATFGFIVNIETYIKNTYIIHMIAIPISIIGEALFIVLIWLFCIKNTIPCIIRLSPEKEKKC